MREYQWEQLTQMSVSQGHDRVSIQTVDTDAAVLASTSAQRLYII